MKKFLSLALALLMIASCGLALASCNKDEGNAKTIKIGLIGPMTGAAAVYGNSVKLGAQLAVEEINASTTLLNGYTIELVVADDQYDPTLGTSLFEGMVEDGIKAIIGPVTTNVTAAVATLANENKVVMVTPSATGDNVTTTADYVFRSCFNDSYQGVGAAKYAHELGFTKVGVLYDVNDTYSNGLYGAFVAECARLGIEVVAQAGGVQDTDFSTSLAALKTAVGADGFIFAPYYYDVVGPKVVPQARTAGFNGIIMGADGYDGMLPDNVAAPFTNYNNVYFTNHYSAESTDAKVQGFISAYKTKFSQDPTAFSALSYDAAYMLATAIEKALEGAEDASGLTGEAIKNALHLSTFAGVTGNIKLSESGTPVKDIVVMKYAYNNDTQAVEIKYVKTLAAAN